MRHVGIESWGVYIPKYKHTSEYIARKTGIPKDVLEDKFGIRAKTVPGPDDHTVKMGANASFDALKKANLTPDDIDIIIWAGEVYAEHPMMTYGIKLQKYLGNPRKAWAFDINQRCGTFLVSMLIAKSFMQTNPKIQRILIASGYRNADLIDYNNSRARFMTSLAASGVAAVIKGDSIKNEILGISVMTDGAFADDVYVPAGGTVMPISKNAIDQNLIYLDVPDPEGLKERLDERSMSAFIKVIDDALEKSALDHKHIDYLALLHMKRSAYEYVAKEVGVDPYKQTTYLEEIGHNGQNDGILSIDYGVKNSLIKSGDIVVIAAAGIGWAWNAGVIRWG